MRFAPKAFRLRTLEAMRRVYGLGLVSYKLELSDDGYLDLVDGLRARPKGDEVHVVEAIERLRLRGIDAVASSDAIVFTVVRRGRTWSVVADDGLSDLGVLPARAMWDFGAITRIRSAGVSVLTHGRASVARRLQSSVLEARRRVNERWPYRWPQQVAVVLPRSPSELGAILQTSFDLSPFVAFATSSVDRAEGAFVLGAHRVYVQPETFFSNSRAYQDDTLSHELLHLATRPHAGAFTPAWLDEAVAQNYGERRLPRTPILASRARSGRFDGRLPREHEFIIGTRDSIHLAYEESSDFVAYLQRRFGTNAGARLYRAMGRERPDRAGNATYHLDHATRAAFKVGFSALQRAWARDVRRRF